MTEERPARQGRERSDDRSRFDRFVAFAHGQVSRAWFFYVCLFTTAGWAAGAPWWPDLDAWQSATHTASAILAVLLLALLQNAARRADEAADEKLNVIAEALAALMSSHSQGDPELTPAVERLRVAVGLEDRH